jgi:myo-inositol-1(or 4)-monophosphatase
MNQPVLADLEQLARQAGLILRAGYGREHQVGYKGAIDLVTEVDHQSEALILTEIQRFFHGHRILAEESGAVDGCDGHLWYVDPLDGTVNYAHGVPFFSVAIAYARDGQTQVGVVYDPIRDELFSAERGRGAWLNGCVLKTSPVTSLNKSLLVTGFPYNAWVTPEDNIENFSRFSKLSQGVRRLGSAALDLCYIAAGRLDGYWELTLSPWDVAAGGLIAEEAGAIVTNLKGGPDYLSRPNSILAAAPGIHAAMLEVLGRKASLENR